MPKTAVAKKSRGQIRTKVDSSPTHPAASPPRNTHVEKLDKELALQIILTKLKDARACDWDMLKRKGSEEGIEAGQNWSCRNLDDLYEQKILPALQRGKELWRDDGMTGCNKALFFQVILAKLATSKTADWYLLSLELKEQGMRGMGKRSEITGSDLWDIYHYDILPALKSNHTPWSESGHTIRHVSTTSSHSTAPSDQVTTPPSTRYDMKFKSGIANTKRAKNSPVDDENSDMDQPGNLDDECL
ncbi:uncharacterized protein L203_100409 [Cryptococcus depauperatus CBS 7841]|uniref:Uncharacterized protein n=1 Tax=Cryptococcus depauperatus CBS 7841 TaxID=1295531 RepID=A0A1E3HY03_9TREE|nr:hypothetical protein L203_05718 [Cryptococcus depauperatus CBS 7841]